MKGLSKGRYDETFAGEDDRIPESIYNHQDLQIKRNLFSVK